jgi:RNA polymerase sigma factor (sigma-70 family)
MPSRLANVKQNLLGLASLPGGAATDRQLLECFTRNHDQAAFAALLQRHGPMVRGVCQRLLGVTADADDAFQATFLVLVRRAASVGWHESIGGWLHAVACRVAHKARTIAARAGELAHRVVPREVAIMPDADPLSAAELQELRAVLDEEMARLPEKYRLPLVLCYLEGRTNEEAAQQLGWTKGTVSGRLARARDLLRSRLSSRNLALSVAVFESVLASTATASTLPSALFDSTLKAAVLSVAGSTAAGFASAKATTLAEGVSQAMFLTRLKIATVVLFLLCALGTGVTLAVYNALTAVASERKQEPVPSPEDKKADRQADKATPRTPTDEEKLQGTWRISNVESLQQGTKWTFSRGQIEGYTSPNKDIFTYYKLDQNQKPKTIDIVIQDGTDGPLVGRSAGIYQLDGDELKICMGTKGEERPKAFPTEKAPASVLIFKREPPARVVFLDKQPGKPPMRTYSVSLELTNTREQPVWLLTRYSGEQRLTETGKFTASDTTPRMFDGDGYKGGKEGKGEAVQVTYIGAFRAFYLAPKTTIRFDRYGITCWEDIEHFEVWEVSSLQVNGRTALDKWLPYRTRSEGDIVIPANADLDNLDWDRKTSRSRTDYPNEPIEFVRAEVIKKWLIPIDKLDGKSARGMADTNTLRQKLKNGTPKEKELALDVIRDLQAVRLIPEVIEAISDPTALPREGDTGWGFVGHQAATVLCELAQALDGVDRKTRQQYTFHTDQSEGGEKLKELGRLEEVRKNWAQWWRDQRK